MKVSTTLERIERLKEQEQKQAQTEKQKKEIKQNYLQEINFLITFIFDDSFSNDEEPKKIYNKLLIDSNFYINDIEKAMRKINKDQEFIYSDFNFLKDINEQYFSILKTYYKKEELKDKAKKEEVQELLKRNIKNVFQENNYNDVIEFLYSEETKKAISNKLGESKRQKKYIESIYFKTIEEIKKEFKAYNKQEPIKKVSKREQKQMSLYKHRHSFWAGCVGVGLLKGLIKASKK